MSFNFKNKGLILKNSYNHISANYLSFILNIVVLFLIIYSVVLFSQYNVIEYDDIETIFYKYDVSFKEQFFLNVYHGRYISNIFQKLMGFSLNIHPNIWIQTYGAFFKGCFMVVFVYTLAKMCFIFEKSKYMIHILALFCYIVYQYTFQNTYQNELYSAFFGFTFPFIFFFTFWNFYIRNYYVEDVKRKTVMILSLFSFLTAISTEFNSIVTLCALVIITIFEILNFKSLKKITIYSFLSNTFGVVLFFVNPGLINTANAKGTFDGLSNMIISAKEMLPEYIVGFKQVFFYDFLILTVVIIIMSFFYVLISDNKKNNKIFLILIYSLLISGYIFYFLLLFAGRHEVEKYCYVTHFDIVVQMKILLISIIFVELSFLYTKIQIRNTSIIILIILSIILNSENIFTTLKVIKTTGIINYIKSNTFHDKEEYKNRYMSEAILVYYIYKDKIPVLPEDAKSFSLYCKNYIRNVYKIDYNNTNIEYVDSIEKAYEIYKQNGGRIITENELEKSNFQKLKDKNFVIRN